MDINRYILQDAEVSERDIRLLQIIAREDVGVKPYDKMVTSSKGVIRSLPCFNLYEMISHLKEKRVTREDYKSRIIELVDILEEIEKDFT